jgi:hypothetical protein
MKSARTNTSSYRVQGSRFSPAADKKPASLIRYEKLYFLRYLSASLCGLCGEKLP